MPKLGAHDRVSGAQWNELHISANLKKLTPVAQVPGPLQPTVSTAQPLAHENVITNDDTSSVADTPPSTDNDRQAPRTVWREGSRRLQPAHEAATLGH